jgi:hypothetical protein
MQDAHIRRAGTDLSIVAADPGLTPWSCLRGIAVDAGQQKIYVTATNLERGPYIARMNLDGSQPESLQKFASGARSEPRDLALDPGAGRMYWSDFGTNSIRRADLAPGSPRTDVITGLSGPSGIALDLLNDRIYWTETNGGSIGSANLDGTGAVMLITGLRSPSGLAVDVEGDRIYWSEIGTPRICSARLDGTDVMTLPLPVGFPAGIWVDGTTAPADAPALDPILAFALERPTPNPVATATALAFTLPEAGPVRMGVFDVQGREVVRLVDAALEAGRHVVTWEEHQSRSVAGGVYFVRCVWNGQAATQRVTWIR